jgi:hypothetical protein
MGYFQLHYWPPKVINFSSTLQGQQTVRDKREKCYNSELHYEDQI